jgi:hypothetical protein
MRAELHAIRGWMWRDRELFERVADENKIAEDFRIDPPVLYHDWIVLPRHVSWWW